MNYASAFTDRIKNLRKNHVKDVALLLYVVNKIEKSLGPSCGSVSKR